MKYSSSMTTNLSFSFASMLSLHGVIAHAYGGRCENALADRMIVWPGGNRIAAPIERASSGDTVAKADEPNVPPPVVDRWSIRDTNAVPDSNLDILDEESQGATCPSILQRRFRNPDTVEKQAKGLPLLPVPHRKVAVPAERQAPCPEFRSLRLIDPWHHPVDLGQWRGRTVVLVPWEVGAASARTLRAVDAMALRYPEVVFLAVNLHNSEEAIHGWLTQRGHFPNLRFLRTAGKRDVHGLPGAVVVSPDQRSETSLPASDALAATLNRRQAGRRR